MLRSISVRHFQALHSVDVDLAPLTVIVGQSSSGKSAFVRALHALTHNRRGTEWIEHGETAASITATTERHTVTLERTHKPGDGNAYTLTPHEPTPTDQPARFTKLGASVPEAVTAALGIIPDGLTFAGQHSMPFMLDDTPQSNATALGRLTNVHKIFDAAREANRQRTQHGSTLRTRAEDLERLQQARKRYARLPEQQQAIERAEQELGRAARAARRLDALSAAVETVRITQQAIPSLQAQAARTVPDLSPATEAASRLQSLTSTLAALHEHHGAVLDAQDHMQALCVDLAALSDARAAILENLSADIERAMQPHAITHETIHTPVAARVAAEYIRDVL